MGEKVRTLIVDDSKLVRDILREIFERDPGIEIVGEAADGREAIKLTKELAPDIITMDIQMPKMDGFEATEQIMAYHPTPIMVLSSALDKNEQYTSFKAISLGALDTMSKPDITSEGFDAIAADLVKKVKMLSKIHVIPHIRAKMKAPSEKIEEEMDTETVTVDIATKKPGDDLKYRMIAMGASTGGPTALEKLFSRFPADFPIGIVIVQHICKGFIDSLAKWLSTKTQLKIKLAENGEFVERGTVYFAPDDAQLEITSGNSILLKKDAPPWGEFKPSVNYLFKSVGENLRGRAIGVILTGMGEDGADGMKTMYENGAHTIAQDQKTSLIFGMPKASINNKSVRTVLPLSKISEEIFAKVKE
jgi:two-component system chemotaxis response regulator CheB